MFILALRDALFQAVLFVRLILSYWKKCKRLRRRSLCRT